MKISDLLNKPKPDDEISQFMASGLRNQHVYYGDYKLYLRKGMHMILGKVRPTLDLASVENTTRGSNLETLPKSQRPERANFSDLLKRLEQEAKAAGLEGVFVESIHNKFLPDVLAKKGYVHCGLGSFDVCMFKAVK